VQYFGELGAQVEVFRNDEITVEEHRSGCAPTRSTDWWCRRDLVPQLKPAFRSRRSGISPAKLPILGVCLGHQSIGAAFGGKIVRAQQLMHGKTSVIITTTGQGVFTGTARSSFTVNRYHSLAIERESCPDVLVKVTAWTDDGEIMGVPAITTLDIEGVQFHPGDPSSPSTATPCCKQLSGARRLKLILNQ
jgi:anthranilate synthase component 2